MVDPVTHTVIGEIRAATEIPNNGAQSLTISSNGTVYVTLEDTVVALDVDPLMTSQSSLMVVGADSVEGAASPMALLAAVNAGPSALPTVGLPETVSGVVTGKLNAVDPESNPLTYAVQSQSAGATVSVDGSGNFTYTPSQAARLQAATTTGLVVDTDTFTVGSRMGRRSPTCQ